MTPPPPNTVGAVTPLLSTHLRERVGLDLERRVYEKALRLRLDAFETPTYHDNLANAQRTLGNGVVGALDTLRQLLTGLIGAAGIAALIAQVSAPLALLLAAGSAPVAILGALESQNFVRINYHGICTTIFVLVQIRLLRERYHVERLQTERERRLGYLGSLMSSREAAAEIRLFGLAGHLLDSWSGLYRALQDERLGVAKRGARL